MSTVVSSDRTETIPHSRSHLPQNDVVKPDIICEAGNVAWDGQLADWYFEGLSLLTTHHDCLKNPFTLTWATSPATANAARVTTQIWGTNPHSSQKLFVDY